MKARSLIPIIFVGIVLLLQGCSEKEAIYEKNPDLSRWKPDPHLFGQIISKTKDWTDYVTLDEARYIEEELQSTMQRLDYCSYSNC